MTFFVAILFWRRAAGVGQAEDIVCCYVVKFAQGYKVSQGHLIFAFFISGVYLLGCAQNCSHFFLC